MKWKLMLVTAALLVAVLVTPASALEYTFDNPAAGDFAESTSADNTIREPENSNVDRGKNSALIPPGFGTPTSYLPNSGEFLTPNLAAGGPLNSPSLMEADGGGNTSGCVILPGPVGSISGTPPSFSMSASAGTVSSNGYTEVTGDSYYSNGSLGTLKIPEIDLNVRIYQGTSDTTLKKGVGHFTSTSIWNGNVALAAHNRGTNNYFGKIHTLEMGERIILTTKEGTRTYSVTSVMKIDETDNSMLAVTSENCITLFTCVRNERDYRWCIRAVEI